MQKKHCNTILRNPVLHTMINKLIFFLIKHITINFRKDGVFLNLCSKCNFCRSFSDRNHFDNPVYTYQGRRDEDCLLNNTNHIKNNLQKQTNLEKQRLGMPCCSTDDDDLSLKGYHETNSLKNKDADYTNPNIYHGNDKTEHIYYEIKQKDKEIGE